MAELMNDYVVSIFTLEGEERTIVIRKASKETNIEPEARFAKSKIN